MKYKHKRIVVYVDESDLTELRVSLAREGKNVSWWVREKMLEEYHKELAK